MGDAVDFRSGGYVLYNGCVATKLYCYVDESGQETAGQVFIVSVVIVETERESLSQLLVQIEETSGKSVKKWQRADDRKRADYIRQVLKQPGFKGKLHYAQYQNTRDYVALTIHTTAEAIKRYTQTDYKAVVLVDGLSKPERRRFAVGLRQQEIRTEKVRGVTDEAEIFIRLADALCGFLRDALAGREDYQRLAERAFRQGYIVNVGE